MSGRPPLTTRAEDLTFMADTGETHVRAAARLGINLDALEKWCRDNGHRPTWRRLVANSHALGHGARAGRVTQAVR